MTDIKVEQSAEQTAELNERHRARMERKKAIIDAIDNKGRRLFIPLEAPHD